MPTCPVCGYPGLEEPPRSSGGGGSYEICPSCGFQFGVDDDDKGISHEEWRSRWAGKGLPWSSRGIPKPKGWDATAQLAAVTKPVRAAGAKKPATKAPANAAKPTKAKKVAKPAKKAPAKKAKAAKPAKAAKKATRKKR